MSNWDTEEADRIISNDEGLYILCNQLTRSSGDARTLADRLETELSDIISNAPYSDIDINEVDWYAIAYDMITEEE